MQMLGRVGLLVVALLGLAGCASNPPPSIVHQPMTAKPVEYKPVQYADGAIFHAGANERPLFEDRRARNVGDILTINIVEKTTGNRKSSNSSANTNSIVAKAPTIGSLGGNVVTPAAGLISPFVQKVLNLFSVTGSGASSTSGSSAGAASEDLTGTITVTVIEALPNGNLLVSGEKQVGLNSSDEYIRFSGVVNPTTITGANTVQSTQVADARLEYRTAGAMRQVVNDAQTLGFLGRLFMSVLPF
ncbi:MAG TPA: flagellar basal body L-ring protein FlgH [Gallionella sp.]|nr:flagellar basal body L-ring protein FlgH [Gallionella sp.]